MSIQCALHLHTHTTHHHRCQSNQCAKRNYGKAAAMQQRQGKQRNVESWNPIERESLIRCTHHTKCPTTVCLQWQRIFFIYVYEFVTTFECCWLSVFDDCFKSFIRTMCATRHRRCAAYVHVFRLRAQNYKNRCAQNYANGKCTHFNGLHCCYCCCLL